MSPGTGPAVRLALFYAAFFALVGVHLPFWPVWLADRGLEAGEIGVVLACGVAIRAVLSPVLAQAADRRGELRRPIAVFAALALAAYFLFLPATGFWNLVTVTLLVSAFWAPVMPLGEGLALITARRHGLDYGRLRLWGSVGFIVTAMGAGLVLAGRPTAMVFWLMAAASALLTAAAVLLPDERSPPAGAGARPLGALMADRGFLTLVLASALIQGSHSVYYGFATLHWRAAGHGADVIGLLWAEGVVAEVILFWAGAGLVRRLGPTVLMAAGGLAAVVRWSATSVFDSLGPLVLLQALHAFTFGATHLGAIHAIQRAAPVGAWATAQGLHAAVVSALGTGLGMVASGALYGAFGARAFLAMAALGALGAILAVLLARRTPAAV